MSLRVACPPSSARLRQEAGRFFLKRQAKRRGFSNSVPCRARRSLCPLPSVGRGGLPGYLAVLPACTCRKEILPPGDSTEGWRCPIPARQEYARVRYCVRQGNTRAVARQSSRGLAAPPGSARAPRTTREHPRNRCSELFLPSRAYRETPQLLRQG